MLIYLSNGSQQETVEYSLFYEDLRVNFLRSGVWFFRYQSKHSVNAEKAKRDVALTDVIICDDEHLL